MDNIPFSPPDITEEEIAEVVDTLRSGWITTGPKTKKFEKEISKYCGTVNTNCLNSATACLEMTLRLLGIGAGDEVITTAYTYTATASVIDHVGAHIILVDTEPGSYQMSLKCIEEAISDKTKAIISVDIAGVLSDYESLFSLIESKKNIYSANNEIQELFGRIVLIADGAHSFGAKVGERKSGNLADFTSFSFHAVKNLTTAEGGAVTWKDLGEEWNERIYRSINTLSLHGQTKDALAKTQLGSWEYDIISPAYKCNMTDIQASLGLIQLKRYPNLLKKRKEIVEVYKQLIDKRKIELINHANSSMHLMMTRLISDKITRNEMINIFSDKNIGVNVHYKPLPLLTAYSNMGFEIKDFPNAYNMYLNEITLPLHTKLTQKDIERICDVYNFEITK